MRKGIIITNAFYFNPGQKYQIDRLVQEFDKLGVKLTHIKNDNTAYIRNNVIKAEIGDADFVVYLDKDKHLARMLEKSGYRLFNRALPIELSDDKMLTYIAIANNGINMPNTVTSPLCYQPPEQDDEFLKSVVKKIKLPMIVKECHGSFGKQVFLAEDFEQLRQIRQQLKYLPHLYQQYVKCSRGKDMRVVVIGGKVVANMLRENKQDFRSNIEIGGTGSTAILPESFTIAAEKTAQLLNLDFCGVDLLFGEKGEPIVCEVNSNAYFKGVETVTGVNVAGLYAQHILKTIENS